MARTRNFDPNEALDSAMTLFWRRGYAATSVAQLVEETGVNRHSLYETFGDKQALYLKALERFDLRYFGKMMLDLAEEPGGLTAIERFLTRLSVRLQDKRAVHGCMMLNTVVQRADVGDEIAEFVGERLKDLYRAMRDAIRVGQAAGEIRTDIEADEATRFIAVIAEGMTLMRGISDDRRYAEQSIGLALAALRGPTALIA
jgi:TetR/AcrR family transcriptional regulator, transcriptional repressor for nem operon